MVLPLTEETVSPEGMATDDPGGTLTDHPLCTVEGTGADMVMVALVVLMEAMPRFASHDPFTPPPDTLSAGVCELMASSGVVSVRRENPY
jgi:hypothetical protein